MNSSKLNRFSSREYQSELFGAEYTTVRPQGPLDYGPIEFIINDTREYYDLSETILSLKVKILNADNTPAAVLQDKDHVALSITLCTPYSPILLYTSMQSRSRVYQMA